MEKEGVNIVVTPELSITGYTCADLFFQDVLLNDALKGLKKIIEETKDSKIISIIGIPLKCDNQLFNVAVVINKGKILGIVPKTYIPNYNELELFLKHIFQIIMNFMKKDGLKQVIL